MLIKKKEFKIELILFLCFVLVFLRVFAINKEEQENPAVAGEKDEPEKVLVVEYSTGNEALLQKAAGIYIPTPTIPPATATPAPTVTPCVRESVRVAEVAGKNYIMEDLLELSYLKENLYIVNATTKMTKEDFDINYFLSKDFSLEKSREPQILIFHTHAYEGFADSRPGEPEDTVVGAGNTLTKVLMEKYGYQVLHDTTEYEYSRAYSEALKHVEFLLDKYPSIEVIIDLHRDSGSKRVAEFDGKKSAKIMLFNGLCRNTKGKIAYLQNDNLKDNLAFSFQCKLIGDELYPGLMNRIYLKDYRYNMHLKARYLLIELGTEKNTVEEAKNSMEPLADILAMVLGG